MKKRMWMPADLLDLEFFIRQDQKIIDRGEEETLERRERGIYHTIKEACPQDDETVRRSCLLRRWLAARRAAVDEKNNGKGILPGRLFSELITICSWTFFLISFISGWGMALSYLNYAGRTPVNVATFLALFVGSQLLVLTILLFFIAAGRLRTRPSLPLTYDLVRRGIFFLAAGINRMAREPGSSFALLSGIMQGLGTLYGPIFLLPFFLLVQLAAVGFNLGVETAILLKVVGTDVAFGWQSTLQPGAEAVFHLVKLIALPWSWILPAGIGYPDLAQIQGSRLILKEGLYRLSTSDLVSWWPFLCLCVLFYGLLPRLFLYVGGRITCNRLLQRLRFDAAAHRQVLHRMLTPRLSTAAVVEQREKKVQPQAVEQQEVSPSVAAGKAALVLIPDEIFSDCPQQKFADLLRQRSDAEPIRFLTFDAPDVDETDFFAAIKQAMEPPVGSLIILQEAWQPPIEEFFSFIDQLRNILGKKTVISIFLIGKPDAGTIFTRVNKQDYTIWQQKILSRGDPYLQCLRLINL